ncbi:uncharacterized protein FIBRA_03538 [Fibroporia radiculosa]|uniref:CHAT domain-containing protein n=1 Tax=Fibroporia radiculosa TaxID=599839 RepID=J4H2G5_9APHY|nr:uncharacterized protein FIBRA_03538 [Fibroporia radiculosa]CCM01484.1 predicted protein [Fibroporia radiculosa]
MALPFENPVLAANLHFVLGRTRGSDAAVESLRMALLGTAAVHQSFLLSRNGQSSGEGGADDLMQLAHSFRSKSKQLLVTACSTPEGAGSDATLGAAVAIVLIDIFSGGQNWSKTLNMAKSLVNMRGGPAVLLARSPDTKPNTVTGVSRARLLLEIVAVYELFGCLVTCQQLTLLSPNANSWWLDQAKSEDSHSYVERVFGMSRRFIPLLARVIGFVARHLSGQARINELSTDDSLLELDDAAEARQLYTTVQNWTPCSENVPDRVRAGDRIYQNVAQILLLRDVLEVPADDMLVQQHADVVLTLCSECGQGKMGVDLNWPTIIAGSQAFGPDRARVLDIFDIFRAQCCYEIETAEHIVLQVWKRIDEDMPGADWRSVMRDLDLNVLIL